MLQEAEALGHKDKFRLLKSRKLALIVDLDQTLIHTSVDPNIEPGLQVQCHTCVHVLYYSHMYMYISIIYMYMVHILYFLE